MLYIKFEGLINNRTWEGNVRDLKSMISRLHHLAEGDLGRMIEIERSGTLDERERLIKALNQTKWNKSETARLLRLTEGGVRYKMRKFNITSRDDL